MKVAVEGKKLAWKNIQNVGVNEDRSNNFRVSGHSFCRGDRSEELETKKM